MSLERKDREIELYRSLMMPSGEYRDGFGWTTVAGIFFCGIVMMPGAIYLGLMTGGSLGTAAAWVTVALFMELARRSLRPLKREQLVVLLHATHVMMAASMLVPGGPLGWLVYRAYLAGSEAARDAGMSESFPSWFAPAPDSAAILERNLLHPDWRVPILLVAFLMVIGLIKRYTLGYFFFRLTSDIENLPFPLAPIQAQGALALSEPEEPDERDATKPSSAASNESKLRWRIFSLGAMIGLAFSVFSIGVPGLTGIFFAHPVYPIAQPFVDATQLTESILPATPTGLAIDPGIVFIGFIIPFWAVIGTFLAIALTMILNPTLQHFGVMPHWQPGMDTVNTAFANSVDFWLSFGIGAGLGISLVCCWATARDVLSRWRELRRQGQGRAGLEGLWITPNTGRGDYSLWLALGLYAAAAGATVFVCWLLLPRSAAILFFLIFFAFIYSPFISYVNARLLGLSGQTAEIPFVREAAFLFSGARGLDLWLAPVPIENYGGMAQSFRVCELTGVNFRSLIKTDLVALPVLFILSLMFWAFIWKSDAIPSDLYPAAQIHWELAAKNQTLLMSSTFTPPGQSDAEVSVRDSEFMRAIHPKTIFAGLSGTVALYALLSAFGLPVMLIYGLIRGMGQLPHAMLLEITGALLSRFYFQRKFGRERFLRLAPALAAGYFTGAGLVSMLVMALRLIHGAVSAAPF
ncbi:peptide transporter [Candidatus Sumerlaeota bacterium]|nr:peptide transporter [Candidatus Sumerlaeota bacterium]